MESVGSTRNYAIFVFLPFVLQRRMYKYVPTVARVSLYLEVFLQNEFSSYECCLLLQMSLKSGLCGSRILLVLKGCHKLQYYQTPLQPRVYKADTYYKFLATKYTLSTM
jgi:hypothetical protein